MMRDVHISGTYTLIGAIIGAVVTGLISYVFIPNNYVAYEEYSNLQQAYNELDDKYTTLINQNSLPETNISLQDIISNLESTEGINAIESYNLITYVNQYRTGAGIPELSWDPELTKYAQELTTTYIAGGWWSETDGSIYCMTIRSSEFLDAQEAVSNWMEGTVDIPSKANYLLNAAFTQIGGALYYLPDGDEDGCYYFWSLCLS